MFRNQLAVCIGCYGSLLVGDFRFDEWRSSELAGWQAGNGKFGKFWH